MLIFDASSMIYAWDNYPKRQFPGLWKWIAKQIEGESLAIPSRAFDEVNKIVPDCGEWLKEENLNQLQTSNDIVQEAMRIKALLVIVGDKYGSGVGENDLFIIATARLSSAELVSNEGMQPNLPQQTSKWKIPAVCAMNDVAVTCINFIDYIKRSEVVFS